MAHDKSRSEPPNQATRERVLDAAERLLGQGSAAFSMRELAEEAGTSFATPFNRFGSKAAIMLALSTRRIDVMQDRLAQTALPETATGRVLAAVDIAATVMLDAPVVNRAVMAVIGAPHDEPDAVSPRSSRLWTEALGTGAGLDPATRSLALAALPDQLAAAFRGVLSFWTAGEITDRLLCARACAAAAAVLLGFVEPDDRAELLAVLQAVSGGNGAGRN